MPAPIVKLLWLGGGGGGKREEGGGGGDRRCCGMGVGSTVELSFVTLAQRFSSLAHPVVTTAISQCRGFSTNGIHCCRIHIPLISACAYSSKRNNSMHLIKDMCLYDT